MKTNAFGILATLALAVITTACTVDARDINNTTVTPPPVTDGGTVTPTPDAGTPADDLADVYTVEYVAPVGATEVVLEGNLRGDWNDELVRVYDRTITWTGRLEYEKLDRPACVADALNADCGYVVSFWFDTAPYFGCVLDPAGNFREVGEIHVSGPLAFEALAVENGLDGCHYHLRLVRAEPR